MLREVAEFVVDIGASFRPGGQPPVLVQQSEGLLDDPAPRPRCSGRLHRQHRLDYCPQLVIYDPGCCHDETYCTATEPAVTRLNPSGVLGRFRGSLLLLRNLSLNCGRAGGPPSRTTRHLAAAVTMPPLQCDCRPLRCCRVHRQRRALPRTSCTTPPMRRQIRDNWSPT